MPLVESRVVIEDVDIETVWRKMCDFAAFPGLMKDVLEVKCFNASGRFLDSSWKVLLNGSELCWVERDEFIDRQAIRFHQLEGDLEVWEGQWSLAKEGNHVAVDLIVEFDLGIPSLAHILDPIGIRAIKANSQQMLNAIKASSSEAVP
jgi:uncharacterized membrane protein